MKSKLTFLLVPAVACASQLTFAQPPDRSDRPFRQFLNERRAARLASLTEDERAEYAGYVRANKFVAILKRQAQQIANSRHR